MSENKRKQNGFIALISTIIISFVLIGLTTTIATTTRSSRLNALESEFKNQALALAESCVNTALLKIIQNYNYIPIFDSELIPVGSQFCTIESIEYSNETNQQKDALIIASAHYQNSYTVLHIAATIHNPLWPPPTGHASISINSWIEN